VAKIGDPQTGLYRIKTRNQQKRDTMTRYLIAYGLTVAVFLSLDAVWLSLTARRFYAARLDGLMRERPKFGAAARSAS
jgi:hypothetical protein